MMNGDITLYHLSTKFLPDFCFISKTMKKICCESPEIGTILIYRYIFCPKQTMIEKPKLETVAREAGVSTATVSQVLRGKGRISDQTRKKVMAAAAKLHYVPDGRAASMRSGERREIGLLIHAIANPFNAEVISGVSDLLESEGYLVSILDSQDDAVRERRNLEAFIRSSRGGLLWVPANDTPQTTYDLLAAQRIPTVTFLRPAQNGAFDHVGVRNARATREATCYLADLGHRYIAFFGGMSHSAVRAERIEGYMRAMGERGLAPTLVWETADDKISGLDAMQALRRARPEITAIVCNGDMVALGASLALDREGLTPGRHFSIVGFDDILDAAIATPPLTTMAISPYQMGRKLASALLDRLREPDAPHSTTLFPANLVVRGTTGPPPG